MKINKFVGYEDNILDDRESKKSKIYSSKTGYCIHRKLQVNSLIRYMNKYRGDCRCKTVKIWVEITLFIFFGH